MDGALKKNFPSNKSRAVQKWIADNDDELPEEIGRIIDAMARAAARRDHYSAMRESTDRD